VHSGGTSWEPLEGTITNLTCQNEVGG